MVKIGSESLTVWSRIRRAIPDAKLLMKNGALSNPMICESLKAFFEELGVSADRLDLRGQTSRIEHLRATEDIDIILDPLLSNGGATSLETFWLGLPSITLYGSTPASRIGTSFNYGLGLDDFVANSTDEYIAIAQNAASNPGLLEKLRAEIPQRMAQSPMGNAAIYTRATEKIYHSLWLKACQRYTDSLVA